MGAASININFRLTHIAHEVDEQHSPKEQNLVHWRKSGPKEDEKNVLPDRETNEEVPGTIGAVDFEVVTFCPSLSGAATRKTVLDVANSAESMRFELWK